MMDLFTQPLSQNTWKLVHVFFLSLICFFYVSNVCMYLSLSYHRLWINKRFTKLPLDLWVCMLWTGVLRTSWQGCTNTFYHAKSSQMEGPLGLPLGLSVQNQARLQAKEFVNWCDSKELHYLKYPILKCQNIGNAIFCHFFLANNTNKTHSTNPQGNVIPKDFYPKYIILEESYWV